MSATPISRIIPHYCGMAGWVRRKRLVIVFRAFFDESGLNPCEDKVLVMGDFLGR